MAQLSFGGGGAANAVIGSGSVDRTSSGVFTDTTSLVTSREFGPFTNFAIHGAFTEVALLVVDQRRAFAAAEFGSLHDRASALFDTFAALH